MNYWNTTFIWDFIPLLPLQVLPLRNNRSYLFYWIKVQRLVSTFHRLNVSALKEQMKKWQANYIERLKALEDPTVDDKDVDSNRIMQILYFRYMLQTIKLMFIIFNICFFIGLGWYTILIIEQDFILDDPMIQEPNERYFIGYYGWTNDKITAH